MLFCLSHWKGASQSIALQHIVKENRLRKRERGGNLDNTQQLRASSPGMSQQHGGGADVADLGLHFCNIRVFILSLRLFNSVL